MTTSLLTMDTAQSTVDTRLAPSEPFPVAAGGPEPSAAPLPMSKNAQKKAAKAERYAAQKLERRAKEKEAKREKKRVLAAKRAAGELDEGAGQARKRARIGGPGRGFGGRVVVDLGFDDMMSEKVGGFAE